MNDLRKEPDRPKSERRHTIWPNVIWGIPVAALLIVIYLGVQAIAHRGEEVTVTFRRAADARAGETKVYYQGVEAGQLIKILPNKDGRRLDFRLRLVPEAKPGLNSNARFWLIGATPNLTDLSSLKAVVSGVAIGYAPGDGGTPTTHFEGLEHAPVILPSDKGTRYVLTARKLGPVHEGSTLVFHGQAIGRVIDVQFEGATGFRLEVFVFQPYDSLVTSGARFSKISPLRLSFAAGGITADLAPINTLLSGGIDLEGETDSANTSRSRAGTEFVLYESRAAARAGLSGPAVRYEFAFLQAAGDLDENAAVTLLGFQIGAIESARLAYDEHSNEPYTLVTALLYPQRLYPADHTTTAAAWRDRTDAAIERLVRAGFRAQLQTTPALLGNRSIALVKVSGARPATLVRGDQDPRIPAAPGAGFDEITSQAGQFIAKLNAVPLEEIGANLRRITAHLDKVTSSPQLADSVAHLRSALAEIDKLLNTAEPKAGPLLTQLNDAATQLTTTLATAQRLLQGEGEGVSLDDSLQELTEASRSIRSLADYLSRHPESLLHGKRQEK